MRVVGYCRAGPAEAAPRERLADQRAAITAEAARRGWELAGVFDDIAGAQGLLARPGLHRALAAVESRRARALVVTDLARLSTSLPDLAWLLYASRRRNWTLVSLAERLDSGDPAADRCWRCSTGSPRWSVR
jgi:DNA invertase Pin-like site-specific DNA recombinase